MKKRRKLICFVAMPIGNDETDTLYERTVKPLLKSLEITPRRVDQIQSNRDIDDLIFEEIDKADFVIADLTFARPSVYYEAGYARGSGKKVIYTCRRDHFRPRSDDVHENLKIHFDVLMKNTLSWEKGVDARFERTLRLRLSRVTNPLQKQLQREVESAEEAEDFSSLSFREKTRRILDQFQAVQQEFGVTSTELGGPEFREYANSALLYAPNSALQTYLQLPAGSFGTRIADATLNADYLIVVPSLTKHFVRFIARELAIQPLADLLPFAKTSSRCSELAENIVICSLKKGSYRTHEAIIPHYSIVKTGGSAVWKSNYWVPEGDFRHLKHIFANKDFERRLVGIPSEGGKRPVFLRVDSAGNISSDSRQIGTLRAVPRKVTLSLIHSIKSLREVRKELNGILCVNESKK